MKIRWAVKQSWRKFISPGMGGTCTWLSRALLCFNDGLELTDQDFRTFKSIVFLNLLAASV